MRETEELAHLDREIERLLRRRLELVAGPESGSTGYDQCRRAMEAARFRYRSCEVQTDRCLKKCLRSTSKRSYASTR